MLAGRTWCLRDARRCESVPLRAVEWRVPVGEGEAYMALIQELTYTLILAGRNQLSQCRHVCLILDLRVIHLPLSRHALSASSRLQDLKATMRNRTK